jgi:hypothetical protein
MGWVSRVLALLVGLGALAACTSHPVVAHRSTSSVASSPRSRVPSHIVVVVMENRSYFEIVHNRDAPYLNRLLSRSASYSDFHAETHPSEPNYLALFSGSTHRVRSDACNYRFHSDNLGDEVLDAGLTFTAYTESLPGVGVERCRPLATESTLAREPWTDFTDVPAALNQPFTAFPRDYARLPVLSFVIPNLRDSTHSGSVARGDHWLAAHIAGYATWARRHDSWLVITWDEAHHSSDNHIPTLITGAGIVAGTYSQPIDHYDLLRTIEVALGVPVIGGAAHAAPISGVIAR